jgi:hypothetical protein
MGPFRKITLMGLLWMVFPSDLVADWPRNTYENLCISGSESNINDLYLSSTSFSLPEAKGSYFIWPETISGLGENVKIKYIDEFGNSNWPSGGIFVHYASEVQVSPQGHSLTFETNLVTSYHRYDWISIADAYIQMVDSSGALLWTPGGILLENEYGQSGSAFLVEAEYGQFIGGFEYTSVTEFHDLKAQKVDTLGSLLWGPNGVVVCDADGAQSGMMGISDGAGGAIFLWNDPRDSIFPDIYGQRLDADGNRLWALEGVPIIVGSYEQYVNDVLEDGQGGAFFSYSTGPGYAVRLGRIDADGQLLWAVTPGPGGSSYGGIDIVSDGEGGVYVVWPKLPGLDIFAQHYDADGRELWHTPGGLQVSHVYGENDDQEVVSDGAGGFIVVWVNYDYSDHNIYAQHVTSEADLLWGLSDLVVCNQGDWQTLPRALSDGYGGVVASWADWRNPTGRNLYGQRVLSNGILGNFPEIELTVTPLDTPIVIPPSGGSFQFQVDLQNNFGAPLRFDFWTNILLPNGSNYGPLFLRSDAAINTGGSIDRILTQTVPAGAPEGQYLYRVRVGGSARDGKKAILSTKIAPCLQN